MKCYWISSRRMTIQVEVDEHDRITQASPIAFKFLGQPLKNLENWMRRQGGFIKIKMEKGE